MDDLDNILTNIDLEEEKLETEEKDWYCGDCGREGLVLWRL